MASPGGDEVTEEECVEEDTLRAENHEAHERAWLSELEEGEEMHSLVVGFLEKRLNPSIIPTHFSERVEMSDHSCYHWGDAGDGLEKDESDEPLLVSHGEDLSFYVGGVSFPAGNLL